MAIFSEFWIGQSECASILFWILNEAIWMCKYPPLAWQVHISPVSLWAQRLQPLSPDFIIPLWPTNLKEPEFLPKLFKLHSSNLSSNLSIMQVTKFRPDFERSQLSRGNWVFRIQGMYDQIKYSCQLSSLFRMLFILSCIYLYYHPITSPSLWVPPEAKMST